MASFRLAVPESLRPLLAASGYNLITPAMPADERGRERWQRLWLERRKGAGATPAEAAAALQSPSLRAVLSVLDRQADAALVDEAEPAAVATWHWVEPRRAQACSELWLAGAPGANPGGCGWWEARPAEAVPLAAAQLQSAVAAMAQLGGQPAAAAVVTLLGSGVGRRPPAERLLAALRARMAVLEIPVYSPLLFRDGRLQAQALLAEIRRHTGAAVPVVVAPQLERAEVAAWTGPLLAGAEIGVARLRPEATPAAACATAVWLERAV